MVEKDRHIQGVSGGKRKVGAEDRYIDRGGDGVVITLDRIYRAALHGPEKFTGWYQLVSIVQLNNHFAIGSFIEHVYLRFDDMGCEGRTGVGLQPPFNGGLFCSMDKRRIYRCGRDCCSCAKPCLFEELTSFHLPFSFS